MEMKTYEDGPRRVWYDFNIQLWTLQEVDENGYQIGDVDYTPFREQAFAWLRGVDMFEYGWKHE